MRVFNEVVKYQSDRDENFDKKIMANPGCEKLDSCIQCGTCSASCPMSAYMDYTPRQVIYLARAGFKNEIISSRTPWICSACYSCIVACPKQIRVTEIMYAIRRMAIEEGVIPNSFSVPTLIKEFYKMVRSKGRVSECRLAVILFLKTNWFMLLKMRNLGIGLLRTGRFSLRAEHIKQTETMSKLLNFVDSLNGAGKK